MTEEMGRRLAAARRYCADHGLSPCWSGFSPVTGAGVRGEQRERTARHREITERALARVEMARWGATESTATN